VRPRFVACPSRQIIGDSWPRLALSPGPWRPASSVPGREPYSRSGRQVRAAREQGCPLPLDCKRARRKVARPSGNPVRSRDLGHLAGGEMTFEQTADVDGDDEAGGAAAAQEQDSDTLARSYRYLRLAMVGLLLCVAIAVLIQSGHQHWHLLGSVSAYYYTPAQAVFVGGLIGLGACMIALKGKTAEDVALNLGGVFAVVVAIVPTGRSADYRSLIRVCKAGTPLLTEKASTGGLDCPTVQALEQATRANVDNNLWAFLAVGALVILVAVAFAWKDGTFGAGATADEKRSFWWVFGAGTVLELAVLVARMISIDWVIDNGHWISALLLFVCIFVVGVVNARRAKGENERSGVSQFQQSAPQRGLKLVGETVGDLIAVGRHGWYLWIARLMLLVGAVLALLVWRDVITLFWLEAAVFVLFMALWTVQTIEQEGVRRHAASLRSAAGGEVAASTSSPG
jgi:hypothetical protein